MLGIVTDVKPVQPSNAEDPISVTPSGIVTEVKPVQSLNTCQPTSVTPSGQTKLVAVLTASLTRAGYSP